MKLMLIPGVAAGCPGGTRGTLLDVRTDSTGTVWVCGWRDDPDPTHGLQLQPFTAYWTGSAWVALEPGDAAYDTQLYRTAWGTGNAGGTTGGKTWLGTGSTWTYSADLSAAHTQPNLVALDSTHLYTADYTNAGTAGGLLYYHYNGSSWTLLQNGIADVTGERFPYDVFGTGTNDLWVCGSRLASSVNKVWAEPLTGSHTSPILTGVSGTARRGWANASNDLWVAGGETPGTILHRYQGSGWASYTSTSLIAAAPGAHGIAGDVWIVGTEFVGGGLHARTAHYDGSGWTAVPVDIDYPNGQLFGVWRGGASDVWACGTHNVTDGTCGQYLWTLHWDGSAWHTVPI